MEYAIGIDFGTTNSCVAVMERGLPVVIHNRQGGRVLPSVVSRKSDGRWLVGGPAKRQAVTAPGQTVFGIKRLIGRKLSDPALAEWRKLVPYGIVGAENGDAWVEIDGQAYSPQEISAVILEEIKATAESYLGTEVTSAVITVPAYFNDNQRQATKEAAAIAGLEVRKVINEPTAAALAYGVRKDQGQRIAVFDLGGGTFDITIMEIAGGIFEVLATNGDTFLGGSDFDHRLVQHLVAETRAGCGFDLSGDPCALERLNEAVETAKCELSMTPTSAINLPFIASGPGGPVHLIRDPLERALLEDLTADLIERLEPPCLAALEDAGVESRELDQVVLVGGMTRMPAVERKVEEIFGKRPAKVVNPEEIVALGAATQCAIISGEVKDVIMLDVTPHSMGVKVFDDRMSVVIPRNTTIPTSEKKVYGTTKGGKDLANISIEVYQGESRSIHENSYLGRFTLEGLPRDRTGEVSVEVEFLIDADGVVNVSAREMRTGREAAIRIDPSSGLSPAQFERLVHQHRSLAAG